VNATSLEDAVGTVHIVDDDPGVRDSLAWLLKAASYRVCTYDSAEQFLRRADPAPIACLIADVRMPGLTGLELQQRLAARGSDLPIVFLTGHGDVPMAVAAMKNGAADFVEKPFDAARLAAIIDRVLAGVRRQRAARRTTPLAPALRERLTAREQQVLEAVCAGRLNKQVAADLGISIKTVEAHRANLMGKLKARTVAELMRIVMGPPAP